MNYLLKLNSLFVIFVLLLAKESFGQFAGSNNAHERYWFYKTRLNNDFMKVGLNRGESLPIPERNQGDPNAITFRAGDELSTMGIYLGVLATEYWQLKVGHQNTDRVRFELHCAVNALNRLDFNAEGVFQAGAESLNGFLMKDDLYKNFIVDNYAHFHHFNHSSDANGRAVDGSNPPNLVLPNNQTTSNCGPEIHNSNPGPAKLFDSVDPDRGFCGTRGAFEIFSNWQAVADDRNFCKKEAIPAVINQDQFITMLIGLSLINRFVDDTASFWSGNVRQAFPIVPYAETSIRNESRNIADRIWNYFSSTCNWDLFNPVTHIHHTDLPGKGGLVFLNYPISEAVCHLHNNSAGTDGDFYFNPTILGGGIYGGVFDPPMSCPKSSPLNGVNVVPWALFHATDGLAYVGTGGNDHIDAGSFIANLSATCDCGWDIPFLGGIGGQITQGCQNIGSTICDDVIGGIGFDPSGCESFSSGVCTVVGDAVSVVVSLGSLVFPLLRNQTFKSDMQAAVGAFSFYHANLLYEALNGTPANTLNNIRQPTYSAVENLLNSAPCSGPFNFSQNNRANYDWTSDSRIEHSDRLQLPNDPNIPDFPGNYNGLDYMLYYNLYHIVNPTASPVNTPYFDLSNRIVSGNTGCPSGTPCTIGAFETIDFQNQGNTAVTVSSGSQITFQAGMSLNAGSPISTGFTNVHFGAGGSGGGSIHLLAQPFTCTNNSNGTYHRTSSSGSGDYGEMGSSTPSHSEQNSQETKSELYNMVSSVKPLQESSNTTTTQKATPEKCLLFPNPNNGSFDLSVKLDKGDTFSYEILDVLGKTISKEGGLSGDNFARKLSLNSNLKGVFYLRINSSVGYSTVKKFIIQ